MGERPPKTMAKLRERLDYAFNEVLKPSTWEGAFKRVQDVEDDFASLQEGMDTVEVEDSVSDDESEVATDPAVRSF